MRDETCVEKYGSLFSPELKEIFKEYNLSVPHILDFLEDDNIVCDNKECKHHVFHASMEFSSNNIEETVRTETDWVKECHGCMCLISHPLTCQEIADAMGVTKQAVNKTEAAALAKLQQRFKLGGDDEISKRF